MRREVAQIRIRVENMLKSLYGREWNRVKRVVESGGELREGELVDIEIGMRVICSVDEFKWLVDKMGERVVVRVYRDNEGMYRHEFVLEGKKCCIKLEGVYLE